jgi:hypothetical protein
MYIFNGDMSQLSGWISDEVEIDGPVSEGRRGGAVKRIQEWLTLHGFGVAIDSDFGGVTKRAVQRFQAHVGLAATGVVDQKTFAELVQPMTSVLSRNVSGPSTPTLEDAVLAFARAHLDQHPVEVGGQNRGPWVRLYMKGKEGPEWAWCAGFVTFVVHQAVESLQGRMPIEGSFSCDSLAAQGRTAGLFLSGREVTPGSVPAGSIFLVRRTATDWAHTGLVTASESSAFDTIEGNTNDDGDREGFEVCSRSRGYKDKDFIQLSA